MGKLILVVLSFAILFAGCAAEKGIIQPSNLPEKECDLPVWEVGDYWQYRSADGRSFSWKVVELTNSLYVMDTPSALKYKWAFDKKSLQLFEYYGPESKNKLMDAETLSFLNFPLFTGKKWSKVFRGKTTDGTEWSGNVMSYKVISHENVTVPAGTFGAFKIEKEQKELVYGEFVIFHYWYSAQVRNIVKFKFVSSYGDWRIRSTDYELISFKPGKIESVPTGGSARPLK